MTAKKKITLETLAAQMAKGFARHDKRFDKIESLLSTHDDKLVAILEQTAHLTEDMTFVKSLVTVTSDSVLSMNTELRGIQHELREIRKRLDALDTKAAAVDELRARIAAIEKHLGIDKKIAA